MIGFESFWSAWPRNVIGGYSRKGAKAECLKRWAKCHHETQADTILKHVEWLKTTPDWLKDRGLFIPAPLVYLNQQRWDGAEVPEASSDAQTYAQREAELMAASIAQAKMQRPAQMKREVPKALLEIRERL